MFVFNLINKFKILFIIFFGCVDGLLILLIIIIGFRFCFSVFLSIKCVWGIVFLYVFIIKIILLIIFIICFIFLLKFVCFGVFKILICVFL